MIYCMSDIHGRIDLFEAMLDKISLSKNDTLYILGDTIDRGGGLAVLKRIMELQNAGMARFICGNHEENFVNCIITFDPNAAISLHKTYREIETCNPKKGNLYTQLCYIEKALKYPEDMAKTLVSSFAANALTAYSGYRSAHEYFHLPKNEQEALLKFIVDSPTYADVEVNGKKYKLTHAGCNQDGEIDIHIRQEFFKNEHPIKDQTIVFGHTTVKDIKILTDGVYTTPTIWFDSKHNNDKIGIDCGAAFYGGKLACLRLDDMAEFYVDNGQNMSMFVQDINSFAKKYKFPANPFFVYRPIIDEVLSTIADMNNKNVAEGKEKYGEYYAPYISHYPSLSDSEKEEWVVLLKRVDNARKTVENNPNWEYAKQELQESESKLEEFYEEHSIAIA